MKKLTIALTLLSLSAVIITPPSVEAATSWSKYRIMIDPGHGGSDPGASGPSAPHEAELALRCANSLKTEITGTKLGGTVKLTRTSNATLSLSSRRSMSISYDPYIFCSIHLNAFNSTANGTETWYYWTTGNSQKLATKVQSQLVSQLGRVNRGVKRNGWTVITGAASIPAILTEALFVDNPTEWGMINTTSKAGFKSWVNGHLYGFYDHLKGVLGADVVNPQSAGTTPPPAEPTLKVSTSGLHFDCYSGENPTINFTVTGSNLTSNISVTSSHSQRFEISPASLTKTGGTVSVKMANTSKVGTYGPDGTAVAATFSVKVKSGSLEKTVNITANVKAKPLDQMVEKWNFSEKRGTKTQKGYDASKIRNFGYMNGKLYCVYDHSEIKVINAQTGEDLGNLNKGSVCAGGVLTFCDVKCIDGRIVACNLANNPGELRLYCWDNDQSEPYLLQAFTDLMSATRVGDCMELRGSFNGNLVVTFGNDDNTTTRILQYTRNSTGQWSQKAIKVTTDGSTRLATQGTTRVYSQSNGYWIDGKDSYPNWVTVNSSGVAVRSTFVDTGESWGSSHHEFQWGGNKHSVNIVFNGKQYKADGSMDDDKNYKGARARIITDPTGDFTRMEQVADYPSDGLGETSRNINATADAYINTDGSTYAELWVQSTTHGMAYFTYGNPPTHTVDPIIPSTPSIAVTPTKLNLSCNTGETSSGSVKITGSALKGDITLALSGTDASQFSLSTNKIAQTTGKGTVTVTYSPQTNGEHTATLTITSTEAPKVTVSINGTATTEAPFTDEISADRLEEIWISSSNAGAKAWHDIASARSIAYNNGKLYVLHCKAWATPEITILNAYTGEKIGNLSCTGVTGATIQIGDLAIFDGKLVGCNVCTAAQNFRIYKWDNDNSDPQVILARDGNGVNGKIGGGALSVSGDWSNGRLWLCTQGANSVVYFNVNNGTVDTTPHEISLTDENGKAFTNSEDGRGTARISQNADGTFWLTALNSAPARFTAEGKRIEVMNTAALGYNSRGTAFIQFPFGSKTYAAATTYNADGSCCNGHMALIDVTNGVLSANSPVAVVPQASFGAAKNDQRISTVCQSTRNDGTILDLWANIYPQGMAHYSYNGIFTTGVEDVTTKADDMAITIANGTIKVSGNVERIEVYTMAGMMVTAIADIELNLTDLPVGIYIVRAIDNTGRSVARKVAVAR